MKTRLISCLVLLVLMLPLSGCPTDPTITLVFGLWFFSNDGGNTFIGAAFLPNGEMDEFSIANPPPCASAFFGGEVTWQQSGNEVTIMHPFANQIFTGTLLNSTYMTGTAMVIGGGPPIPFIASKAPLPAIQF